MDYITYRNNEDLIKSVLRDNIEARGNDIELIVSVWEKQGLKLTPEQRHYMKKCLSTETITRVRRKIQEYGLYRPSVEIQHQRSFLEEQTREFFGNS